ncbi:MAG: TonB family protein [Arenicellales bacterium]|jgi:protein TonB|nr:TonB family protein [Arenicellales bacterium]MDP6313302.1 TonB family protein [Arenicellales bacterium]MDP7491034.1 TonB family protein [Arenicellales bacterium]MEE1566775.1 TonB family protein [Arenicellales bacterium]HJP45170.1 TonB family protein [Arenicellales bacterium]
MKLPAIASTVAVSGVIHATVLIAWAAFSTHPRPEPALTFSTTIEAVLVDAALDAGQTPEPSTPASDAAATAALAANNKQLHAEVATLLTTRETLESTVTELESDKATLLETRETLEGTITELEQDKSALLADKASLGEQLATVTGERQQLSADKATLLETRETLEGEAEQLAITQAQQQQQLLELESVRVGLSDDLSRLQGVLDLEQRERATLAQKVVTLELARHETVTHLNGLIIQLDNENQSLNASLRQLRSEKHSAEVTLQGRTRRIESLSQQVDTLLNEKRSQRQPAPPAAIADDPASPPAPAIAIAENPPAQKLSAVAEKTSTNLSTATAPSLAAPETGNAVHDVEPRPVAGNPKPVYPRLAIHRQLEGTVILTIDVLPSGKVANISVEAGSGFSLLDQAAIKAVSQWRFTPAHQVDTPTMTVTQSIQFQLDGRS